MNVFHESQVPWPAGRSRTPAADRMVGQFRARGGTISLPDAADRVEAAVEAFSKGRRKWRTTELWIYADGAKLGAHKQFLANQRALPSPAVVVSFDLDEKPYSFAGDKLSEPAQNLAAIAAFIEAIRMQERYGLLQVDEMFQAFAALPSFDWRGILENPSTLADAEHVYREKSRVAHPDLGGSHDAMSALNRAIAEAREVLK